jgi:type VI secretion system protein ImpK
MTETQATSIVRRSNLAWAYQDVMTVVLRVRFRTQRVADAEACRDSVRKMIAAATAEARRQGYTDTATQMALYAIVGFLDESILNSHDPTFADWLRRPLQEELFGGHFAGEYFYRHLTQLLQGPDSAEGADALELHAVCLLLGYRGKFAFGSDGEVHSLLHQIRAKIARVRGPFTLAPIEKAPPVAAGSAFDRWFRGLLLAAGVLLAVCLIAFLLFHSMLNTGLSAVATTRLPLLLRAGVSA